MAEWEVLICDNVGGNKASRENDLRMMIEATEGEWLFSSQVPVRKTNPCFSFQCCELKKKAR